MPTTNRYARHIAALAARLKTLVGDRPVALLDWPFYPNAGDHFIWLGQKVIFRSVLGASVIYECPITNVDFLRLKSLPPNAVLVFSGGGNFGDLYAQHQQFRAGVTAAQLHRRIIFMPQSVMFEEEGRLRETAKVLSLHPDLHVMARDKRSFRLLKASLPHAHCHLHIDSAFALQPVIDEIVARLHVKPKLATLHLLRHDREAREQMTDRAGAVDWAKADDLAAHAATAPKPFATAGKFFTSKFDEQSWRLLWAATHLFAGAKTIVTDRLHGHILALMMRKKHVLLDNSYGKNSQFVSSWTEGDRFMRMGWKAGRRGQRP